MNDSMNIKIFFFEWTKWIGIHVVKAQYYNKIVYSFVYGKLL